MKSIQALLFLSSITLVISLYRHIIPTIPNNIAININGGNADAPVQVDFFLDLACPDSKRNYIQLKKATEGFQKDQLRVDMYTFILPWHRNAFVEAKGLYYVLNNKPDKTLAYVDKVYEKITEFSTTATKNKTELEVVRSLSQIASQATGINEDVLYKSILSDDYKNYVRLSSKLAFQRGTKGTPWIFVNGAETVLGTSDNWFITSADWAKMFNQILKDPSTPQIVTGKVTCSNVNT